MGIAVRDLVRIARVDVDDHDAVLKAMEEATPAMEGDLRPIGGPRRGVVGKGLGGMGDLADMASIRVHREDGEFGVSAAIGGQFKFSKVAAKSDQTVTGSTASE